MDEFIKAEQVKINKWLMIYINRGHFGGGRSNKGIMFFPVEGLEDVPGILKTVGSKLSYYLSEFNHNMEGEYDLNIYDLTGESITKDFDSVKCIKGDNPKPFCIKAPDHTFELEHNLKMMSTYAIRLDVSPPTRNKNVDSVFTAVLTKLRGDSTDETKEILDKMKEDMYGMYKFQSNIL